MSIKQCLDCYNTVKVSEVWPCRSVSNTAHMQHKRCPKFQKIYIPHLNNSSSTIKVMMMMMNVMIMRFGMNLIKREFV